MRRVAVLFTSRVTAYKELEGVDIYDAERDARTFSGGCPIVAHPPCRTWSAFCSHQAKAPEGERELAPLAVGLLLACGGVLEHPAHSRLWKTLNLPMPGESRNGLWCAAVRQAWWGDTRTKSTWLLFSKVPRECVEFPLRLHLPQGDHRRWAVQSKRQRSATNPNFAQWLVEQARKVE